jgi:protein SDA1
MGLDFVGDKGRVKPISDSTLGPAGQDAMWAVVLTKELWRKSIWSVLFVLTPFYLDTSNRNDAKSVAIVAMACFHPIVKVQSASIHFFLGSDQDDDETEASDDEATLLSYPRRLSLNRSITGSRSKDVETPS